MINSKIAISGLSILASLAILGGAAFALFSDQALSTGNKFSTGNADLQITNDLPKEDPALPYLDSIAGVSFTDVAPGFSSKKDFWLKNNSSAKDMSLDVKVDFDKVVTDADLGDALMIGFQCDTNNNGLDGGDPVVGPKSVKAWDSDPAVALATIGPNEGASNATNKSDQDELLCRMNASVDKEVGNKIASQSSSFDVVFDATQKP